MEPGYSESPQGPAKEEPSVRRYDIPDQKLAEERADKLNKVLQEDDPSLESVMNCMTLDPINETKLSPNCVEFLTNNRGLLMEYAFGTKSTGSSDFERNKYAVIATDYLSRRSVSTRDYFVPKVDELDEKADPVDRPFKNGENDYVVEVHDFSAVDMGPFNSLIDVFKKFADDPYSSEASGAVANAAKILRAQVGRDKLSLQAINMLFAEETTLAAILKHIGNMSVITFLNKSLLLIPKKELRDSPSKQMSMQDNDRSDESVWVEELTDNRIFVLMQISKILLNTSEDEWTVRGAAEALIYVLEGYEDTLEGDLLIKAVVFESNCQFTKYLMQAIEKASVV